MKKLMELMAEELASAFEKAGCAHSGRAHQQTGFM